MHILVAHTKGGVGKTTTAIHLAAVLAERDDAALIDLDDNPAALDWAIHGRLPFPVAGISDGRDLAARHAGHVIFDAPARPTERDLALALEDVDLLVIPTPPDALALTALRRMVDMVASTGTPYRVLLTLVPPRPSTRGAWARGVLQVAGVPTFHATIPRLVAFQDAALFGGLVHEEPRGMPGWLAYRAVAKEALTHGEA